MCPEELCDSDDFPLVLAEILGISRGEFESMHARRREDHRVRELHAAFASDDDGFFGDRRVDGYELETTKERSQEIAATNVLFHAAKS